ncbi:MAG: hypothetical protein U1A78_16795 [Polyangia bacterium]
MRRLVRSPLSDPELDWLAEQTAKILDRPEDEQKAEADRLWISAKKNQAKNPLRQVQQKLQGMCSGRERCMYCEDSQGSAIEHFWPHAKAPWLTFVWENLNYACAHCNTHKKADFPLDPQTHEPLLLNPTAEDPLEHLVLTPHTGEFAPRLAPSTSLQSPRGQASIKTFDLNRAILAAGRRDTWASLQVLICAYDASVQSDDTQRAERIATVLRAHPFSSVLIHLLHEAAASQAAQRTTPLDPACVAALGRRPEIAAWVA